ncbi:MAG: nickel pincer cofactor biosynthesis protein LarC [Planctomycetia bacterium]|nr:nickel pincer cofactor biosynthesis protein LarC [Planctomycetia bacterium]
MRIAYLDCCCGISGDMTLGALIDAGADVDQIIRGIDSLGLPEVELRVMEVTKGGFRALQVEVEHPEQHAHRNLKDITKLIDGADDITKKQKALAKKIFQAIAEAEAHVHGTTIDKVHFHEVGAIDSIVDIVGAAIGFDLLGVDEIVASPVPTGRGRIEIAHGVCPIPAPATAELLKGIPLVDLAVEAELTTPTGAAILKALVTRFSALPEMTVESIGYGAGSRDLADRANILRLFVGESAALPESDEVVQLETNLDDVTPEVIAYTKQKLFDAGAVDVFTTPIQMKKNRPGVLLAVLCRPADLQVMENIIFTETFTFGIRRQLMQRSKRARQSCVIETPFGLLQGKLGWRHGERPLFTPEFDACAKMASERKVPIREIYRVAEQCFAEQIEKAFDQHEHDHDGGHDHDHDSEHDHDCGHDHDHDGSHDHDCEHDHDHDKGHSHDHDSSPKRKKSQ